MSYSSVNDTKKHIGQLNWAIRNVVKELEHRGKVHDASKMEDPELKYFDEFTPKLKELKYGTEEYKQSLEDMKPAIEHHYSVNSHHPEYHENGISGMNLIDLVEMFCDWWAATKRTKGGDLKRSIDLNKDRFQMTDQLHSIFMNSVPLLEDKWKDNEDV